MCTIAESAEIRAALRLAGRPHVPFRCCAMVTVSL